MTIKIYRAYSSDENHIMSIVASDSDFGYAATEDSGFDDERKVMLIETLEYNKKELPKDVDGWVALAMYNISGFSYVNVTGEEKIDDSNFFDALEYEIKVIKDAQEYRDVLEQNSLTAAADAKCPPATQDIALNLKNRKNAIDTAMYGPLNPDEPNDEYWQALASEWSVDVQTAKQQRCGNCAVFVITSSMKNCISQGLTGKDQSDEFDAIDEAGELGYCEAFDFKCASARTCRAWVSGGPIDDSKVKE
jgi:hypothetical protein